MYVKVNIRKCYIHMYVILRGANFYMHMKVNVGRSELLVLYESKRL